MLALANKFKATGRIGKSFASELLKTGKHTVTALVRPDTNKANPPAGVKTVDINYDDESSLVSALQGQDFIAITLSVFSPEDTHSKLVKAAVKAGVKYIMPNVYGSDPTNGTLAKEALFDKTKDIQEITNLGGTYILLSCGFWYEWSLVLGEQWFGFSIKDRKVTFFDDGNTKIDVSTWDQCGRAVAGLLSLPESGASPAVTDWKNKPVYIHSFKVSQRDMLDSLNRVLGTTDKDWEIKYEPTAERYKEGLAELQQGVRTGFAKAMYSRVFFPNGDGDFGAR